MADAFEAMTGTRPVPGRSSRSPRRSPSSARNIGTQFDAACVAALAEIVDLTVSLPDDLPAAAEKTATVAA